MVSDFPPSSIDTTLFTHLYYAFLVPNNETFELDVSDHSASTLRSFTSTIRSKNPPVKKLLAIGGWSACGKVFSEMAKEEETRKSFINSCIRVAREYGFDGIDLDWEFPQDSQDMTNLGQLLEELEGPRQQGGTRNRQHKTLFNRCRGPNRGYKFPSGRTPVVPGEIH